MARYSLDSVSIDGFRGLRNLRLDNLGLINVLVGPNNSGKTSVLEALSILCNAGDPTEWIWVVHRRDFGGLDETRIQSLQWCFQQGKEALDPESRFVGECDMTCEGRFPLRKLKATCTEIEEIPARSRRKRLEREHSLIEQHGPGPLIGERDLDLEPRRGAEIKHRLDTDGSLFRSGLSVPPSISLRVWENDPVPINRPPNKRSRAPTETVTTYSYQINSIQVRRFSRYILGREKKRVIELVRQLDPQINDINLVSLRGVRPAIYLDHDRLGQTPLSIFGDGLRRVVLLAGTIPALKDGGVLLIDEIEAGIHVSALQRVFEWLAKMARELRVQVVATTHSLEAVDAIAQASPDGLPDLVTYHLEQTEQETKVRRIDGELLTRLRRERALDVR